MLCEWFVQAVKVVCWFRSLDITIQTETIDDNLIDCFQNIPNV